MATSKKVRKTDKRWLMIIVIVAILIVAILLLLQLQRADSASSGEPSSEGKVYEATADVIVDLSGGSGGSSEGTDGAEGGE